MKPPQYYSRLAQTRATQGGNLPHWSQWCATFTTFRLADSLPEGKLEQLRNERAEWLLAHGLEPLSTSRCPPPWGRGVLAASIKNTPSTSRVASPLSAAELAEYHELFPKRFHAWLDAGEGSCVLSDPRARSVVEETIRHFADVRYSLYAFVVKPNHIHVLFMPEGGFDSREIVANWKSFSAHEINQLLGRSGVLWQKESYDRLVRDVDQFNAYRAYIRQNDPILAYDAYAELSS